LANNRADCYYRHGKFEMAERLLLEALTGWKKALGVAHPNIAMVSHSLARLYMKQHRYDDAERMYKQAVDGWRSIDRNHPNLFRTLTEFADLLHDMKRNSDARAVRAEAEAIQARNPQLAAGSTVVDVQSLYSERKR